jgi:DNA polymerase-1
MNETYRKILDELKKEPLDMNINSKVLIVDGLNQYIRAFCTSPVTNDDGLHIGGITGFFLTIGYAIKQIKPTRVIIVFDGKGGSQRRRKVYSEYKNNRKPGSDLKRSEYLQTDEDIAASMVRQMQRLGQYLTTLPVTVMIMDNVEADDVIAYTTKLVKDQNGQTFIMSTDRDFLQLVCDTVHVWSPTKKKLYFKNDILEEYGISAENFLLYRAITGDKSDNLPKVNGIGANTLIKKYPMVQTDTEISIDMLFDHCKNNLDNKVLSNILKEEKMVRMNYQLMQLKDVDISGNTKLKILNLFESHTTPFVKPEFMKLLIEDKATNAIKNLDNWCFDVFNQLSIYARKNLGEIKE